MKWEKLRKVEKTMEGKKLTVGARGCALCADNATDTRRERFSVHIPRMAELRVKIAQQPVDHFGDGEELKQRVGAILFSQMLEFMFFFLILCALRVYFLPFFAECLM